MFDQATTVKIYETVDFSLVIYIEAHIAVVAFVRDYVLNLQTHIYVVSFPRMASDNYAILIRSVLGVMHILWFICSRL